MSVDPALLNYYAGLLIVQYSDKFKANQTIKLLVNQALCDGLPQQVQTCFDLETAVGVQLDVLGRIVGVPRDVYGLDLDHVYFQYNLYNTDASIYGFRRYNNAPEVAGYPLFRRYNNEAVYTLTDAELRLLIKLKIILNNTDSSLYSIQSLLNQFFGNGLPINNVTNGSYEEGSNGTRDVAFGVTAVTASGYNPGGAGFGPENMFDNDPNTFWEYSVAAPNWVKVDLTTAKAVTKYSFNVPNDPVYYGRMPSDWTFEGSNTGAFAGEQTVLDTQSGQSFGTGGLFEYSFSNNTSFRYYRLNITGQIAGGLVRIAQMSIFESTPVGWSLTGSGAVFSRSDEEYEVGNFSGRLERKGADCAAYQDVSTIRGLSYWLGKVASVGQWVKSSTPNTTYVYVGDGVSGSGSNYHPGDGLWRWMNASMTIAVNASGVYIGGSVYNINSASFFDGAILVEGSTYPTNFYDGNGSPIRLIDNLDMTITYEVASNLSNALSAAIYLGIIPKPMGVYANINYV